jgi:DNA-binding PadR family transcriptional regulator
MSLTHAILILLDSKPGSGYDLVKRFKGGLGWFWNAKHQQVYQELKKLSEAGWLAFEEEAQDSRPDKKNYHLTPSGHAELQRCLADPVQPPRTNDALQEAYEARMKPSLAIAKMVERLGDNRSQIMLGLQHDANNPNSKLHDHPLEMHIDATLKNREEINKLLDELKKQSLTDKQKELLARFGDAPDGLCQLVIGGPAIGEALVSSKAVPILSATGSTRMGGIVGPKVTARWGRPILELGGNNAMIVAPSADLDMAVRAIVFGAVGTAGQRCTSLRRLIVHHSIRADLMARLTKAYGTLPVGDPRKPGTLIGPLLGATLGGALQLGWKQAAFWPTPTCSVSLLCIAAGITHRFAFLPRNPDAVPRPSVSAEEIGRAHV